MLGSRSGNFGARHPLVLALTLAAVLLAACAPVSPAAPAPAAPAATSAAPASAAPTGGAAAPAATESTAAAPAASAAGGKKIGFIIAAGIVSRWQFDEKGFTDEAKALGDTPVVASSQGSAQTQASQVDNMITQKVDALVITPVDIKTAATLFNRAKDAGIPTVDYNFIVPDYAPNAIIMRDAREFGRITAQRALQEKPTGNYVIVGGDAAQSVAQDTTQGYLDVLQPQVDAGKIKIVSQKFNTGWSPQSAQSQVEEALVKTNNDVAAILSNNDGMAVGAMQVLKQQNLLGKVFVSGVDADLPNIQAIAQGNQAITIWTDFSQMGQFAARAADAAARGSQPDIPGLKPADNGSAKNVPTVVMETIVVDQKNLCEWIKKYGWVSYDDAYKFVQDKPQC